MKKIVNFIMIAMIIGVGGIVISACNKNERVTPLVEIQNFESSTITMDVGVLPAIQLVSAEYEGVNVDGTISWDNNELKLGENSYGWTFTPTNKKKYNVVKGEVVFTGVKKLLTAGVDFEIVYDDYIAIDEGLGSISLKEEYSYLGTVEWEVPDLKLTSLGQNAVSYVFIPFNDQVYESISNNTVIVDVGNFRGGTGTQGDPYQIATAEQLNKITDEFVQSSQYDSDIQPSEICYKLVDDIDLSNSNLTEKGNDNKYKYISSDGSYLSLIKGTFSGILDGNGKTINLGTVSSTLENYVFYLFENVLGASISSLNLQASGPVSFVRNAGDISNLSDMNEDVVTTFDGITLTGNTNSSVINYTPFIYKAGFNNKNSFQSKIIINNCINYYNITSSSSVGAFIAYIYSTVEFNYCSNYADISGNTVGVLVATKENVQDLLNVNNCYNYGKIVSINNIESSGLVTFDESDITNEEILTGIVNAVSGNYQGSVSKKEQ